MACASPLLIKNRSSLTSYLKPYVQVPCNYCLNCRVDKRNYLEDMCNYEYKRFGVGAFVTVTYDNNHIINNRVGSSDLFSLNKEDSKKYIKRIRRSIEYHSLDSYSINKNFKYVVTGEYGEETSRIHMHYLFFGLDFMNSRKLLLDCWPNGNILVRPIKKGGIRYVLKYLDKQLFGDARKQMYDNRGLQPPFSLHSKNLGTSLIYDNLIEVIKNNWCYRGKHNILRPVPSYIRNKFFGRRFIDNDFLKISMKSYNIKPDNNNCLGAGYSLKQVNDFRHKQALIRNNNLVNNLRSNGIGVNSPIFTNINTSNICILDSITFGVLKND